jgi:hypothetical protein
MNRFICIHVTAVLLRAGIQDTTAIFVRRRPEHSKRCFGP